MYIYIYIHIYTYIYIYIYIYIYSQIHNSISCLTCLLVWLMTDLFDIFNDRINKSNL